MRKRDLAKRAAVKSPEKWSGYKHFSNAVRKKINLATRSYCHGLISEHQHNPNKMWQSIITKVLNRSSNSARPTSLTIEGKTLSRERDIVEAINHFLSVGPKLVE